MISKLPEELGDFRIEGKLGQGAMGTVYRARQTSLHRIVALKVLPPHAALDPAFIARFKQEARAAAALNHPHIVQIYAAGESGGTHFFAMEYVDGETLGARVVRKGRLDPREAVATAIDVAQALDYAWKRARIIHRDIKPDNIFLSREGEVKLGDLGLAKVFGDRAGSTTQSGISMGTPYYVSPEQACGNQEIDFRADIYSLGCTLYHMLTGVTPYQGDSAMGVMVQHLTQPPPAIQQVWPECPPAIVGLLDRMLRKDAGARHQSYEELIEELQWVVEKCAESDAPSSPEISVIVPIPKPAKRVAWRPAVLAGAILLIATGALLWTQRRQPSALPATVPPKNLTLTDGANQKPAPPAPLAGPASKVPPWENSLGMKFVPVPGTTILMCIHETRNGDYAAYAAENPGVDSSWIKVEKDGVPVSVGPDHPVVNVNWDDANAFCAWLSKKEGRTYRLPTDREWSFAVGTGRGDPETPARESGPSEFPWGAEWPPPTGAGNYCDLSYKDRFLAGNCLEGYLDGFPTTSPVMSFKPNELGLYDLGGNVKEWCADSSGGSKLERLIRGGGWVSFQRAFIASSFRGVARPTVRENAFGFRCVVGADSTRTSAEPAQVSTPTAEPSATPDATNIQPAETFRMALLLDADFGKSTDGFSTYNRDKIETAWDGREHRIVFTKGGLWMPAEPALQSLRVADFVCEVEARIVQATKDDSWGLGLVRHSPPTHPWTGVMINGVGQIRAHSYDERSLLPWKDVPEIVPVSNLHTLRVEVVGTRIRIFINGRHFGDCVQDRLQTSALTLFVSTSKPPVEVRFRRVRVWRPAE